MHPAEVAASSDAPSRFAQRTNRDLADTTCNLVTLMLPLEPNGHSSCSEGARTVLSGNSPRNSRRDQSVRQLRICLILLGSVDLRVGRRAGYLTKISCCR